VGNVSICEIKEKLIMVLLGRGLDLEKEK